MYAIVSLLDSGTRMTSKGAICWYTYVGMSVFPSPILNSSQCIFALLRYSCTMAARGLRGMREWRRYIDHEGRARVGL